MSYSSSHFLVGSILNRFVRSKDDTLARSKDLYRQTTGFFRAKHAFYTLSQCCSSPIRPYLDIVSMICSISCGPSFFRIKRPMDIQSRISPPFFQTAAPIYLAILLLVLGRTFSETSKNCSSVYLGKNRRLNLDCNGALNLLISLHEANTLAFSILKSYWRLIWSTLMRPLQKIEQLILETF